MIPPWRGKSPSIPLTTHLNDCPVFRYTPLYLKNKFNVKRKHIEPASSFMCKKGRGNLLAFRIQELRTWDLRDVGENAT
jgi:hypothetical protein